MGGKGSTHGRLENAYKMLIGKPEQMRHRRRPRGKCEDNIKMGVKEVG